MQYYIPVCLCHSALQVPGGQWDAGLQLPLHQLPGDHSGAQLYQEACSLTPTGHRLHLPHPRNYNVAIMFLQLSFNIPQLFLHFSYNIVTMFPQQYHNIPTTFQKVLTMFLQCPYNSPSTLYLPLQLLVVENK